MLTYAGLLLGFVLLIKGAHYLVEGASTLARRMGVSDLVIGMTIVALGTSLPELIVSVFAVLRGATGIAIGNVVGSNIANILLVLAASALFGPVIVSRGTVRKEIPFCLLAAVLVAIMPNDVFFDGAASDVLSRSDGLVLLGFLVLFLTYIMSVARSGNELPVEVPVSQDGVLRPLLKAAAGIAGLALGGKWVVGGAVAVARLFRVSEDVIGLTVVAIGTSLPELATSAVAVYRKNSDIAVGNVVGSNIFNIFLVLAITGVIRPLPFSPANNVDVLVMIGVTVMLLVSLLLSKEKYTLHRRDGVMYLAAYAVYLGFLAYRG